MKTFEEVLGTVVGGAVSPLLSTLAFLRRGRVFHPDGVVYEAEVTALATVAPLAGVAARLAGGALVRLSSGIRRLHGSEEPPDALGCAVRFHGAGPAAAEAGPADQDLLCATFTSLATLPAAPKTTEYHDYLDNDYYGVEPFDVDGVGRAFVRLAAARTASDGATRTARLEAAVREGRALFRLEVGRDRNGPWEEVAAIRLVGHSAVDQDRLRFSPFHTGRGIVPRGFVQALRRLAYPASAAGRTVAALLHLPPR